MIYTLVILFFFQHTSPILGAKMFTDKQACEVAYGEILTNAAADDTVLGWLPVDECKPVGGTPSKG